MAEALIKTEMKPAESVSAPKQSISSDSTILLSSGHRMPMIGVGTSLINDKEAIEATLTTAIDVGYRLIDTAFGYMNQNLIGDSLKKMFDSGKVKREDVFIVDKLPNNGMRQEHVEYFCKKSLAALQVDYIDLYLIHSPISTMRTSNDNDQFPFKDGAVFTDTTVDLSETWKAMESLVRKGYTRSLGLSNFNSKQIQLIYDGAKIKPANLQVECHVYLPQYKLQKLCESLNISVTAYSPLGTPNFPQIARDIMGINYGDAPKLLEEDIVKNLAQKYQKSPAQILLRYLVQRGIVPTPKSVNPERIKKNFQIFDFVIDEEDWKLLESLENGFRFIRMDFWKGMKEHPEYPFHIPF